MPSPQSAYRQRPAQYCIAAEGFPFIAIAIGASLLLWLVGLSWGAMAIIPVILFIAFFFRNPDRGFSGDTNIVVAPADGRILSVVPEVMAPVSGQRSTRISIFMSVLNVHINRFPVTARVKHVEYTPGKFFVASLDKACEHNERNAVVLETEQGKLVTMVQIAGLVARRIVCYIKEGDSLPRSERFGLIRFGSRVDLYVPPETLIEVTPGQRTRSGETVLGRLV